MTNQKITKKLTLGTLPASRKIYVPSPNFTDVKVAMREIKLSEKSENKSFVVYDPSGVYSDQDFIDKIDLNAFKTHFNQYLEVLVISYLT